MPVSAAQQPVSNPAPPAAATGSKSVLSWAAFQRKYLRLENGVKYEWVNGAIEKSKRTDKTQLYILYNLLEQFERLKSEGKVSGRLISEADLFFLSNHRRPDIAWLTSDQIYRLSDADAYEVPAFVIEVISTNDQANLIKRKLSDYRNAGVQTVWLIYPQLEEVEVYAGERLTRAEICSGDVVCSAAPALPHFTLPAQAVFYKQKK